MRPASHTNALGALFIADEYESAQHFFQGYESLGSWFGQHGSSQKTFPDALYEDFKVGVLVLLEG